RGGRGPDLGPAALPGRYGLADSVVSACVAHVIHRAVAFSVVPARTLWASYEMDTAPAGGPRLPAHHEEHLKRPHSGKSRRHGVGAGDAGGAGAAGAGASGRAGAGVRRAG